MSGSASLGLEQAVLGHTLGYAAMPFPAQVFVALCAMAPAPSETTAGAEVSGGGYVRAAAAFALADPPANIAANTTAVEYPTAAADWGTVGFFELWDAPSGGHRLYWGTLLDPVDSFTPITITINAGDITRFSPGALAVMAATSVGSTITIGGYLPLTGGVMQGTLTLAADPTAALAAATKQYVDAGRGAAFSPITATGSLTPRKAEDRFAATYDLRDFGAKCDGIADDSAAFSAAIAKLITFQRGGKLILAAGRTLLASAITATIPAGVTLTIEGMGRSTSELYFSTASDGLAFTLANSGTAWGGVHLRGFTVTRGPATPAQANTGLSISVPAGPMYAGASSLRDLMIQGSGGSALTNQWLNSVVLIGIGGITIDTISILGVNSAPTDRSDVLLALEGGPSGSQYAASYAVSNCYLQGGSAGIVVSGFVQGVYVNNSTVIGQYDSIRWTGGSAYVAEEIAVTNCSLNGGHRGVLLSQLNQASISNTTILRFNGNATANFAGIEINQGAFNTVTGNNIIGALAGTETGILLSACGVGPNAVVGNITGNLNGAGVWCQGNSAYNTVVGNNLTGGTGIIQDTLGNTILGNQWNGASLDFKQTGTTPGGVSLAAGNLTLPNNSYLVLTDTAGGTPSIGVGADNSFALWATAASGGGRRVVTMAMHSDTSRFELGVPVQFDAQVYIGSSPVVFSTLPFNATNDAGASAGGVPLGGIYRNGSVLQVRVL